MNCQRLATFGYDLCSLGVDGHQKNYHAGPDSLKILYCTRNHRNLQRQLRSRPVCLQKGTMAERKYQRKKVDTLLPFFNSKVEKGKYHVYNAQNWRKLGCLWFFFLRLVHNLWSQDYYRFSSVWMNLKYPGGGGTHTILTNKRKKKYFQSVFLSWKKKNKNIN